MAISAHFTDDQAVSGKPRAMRRTLQLGTLAVTENGTSAPVLIHNISTTGLLIETPTALTAGEIITIELPDAGATAASVIWQSGALFGCQFETPIARAALSAAQLRAASKVDLGTGQSATSQSAKGQPATGQAADPRQVTTTRGSEFAARLQRLRKQRGLSLAQVADQLGVSKPTVWAWEQGKAHPVENRIAALANALGVSTAELAAGAEDPAMRSLVAECRERIAEAFGVNAEKVRITIEV